MRTRYLIGAHFGHILEFLVAFAAYLFFFADGSWKTECAEWRAPWMAKVRLEVVCLRITQCTCLHFCCKVIGFNLACEIIFVASWHWLTYMSDYSKVRVSIAMLGWEFVLASRQLPNLIGLCFVVYTFRSLKSNMPTHWDSIVVSQPVVYTL